MKDITDEIKSKILNLSEEKKQLWKSMHQPVSVHFEITPRCNFKCVHCYMQDNHYEPELSLQKIKKIVDKLYNLGVLFITFTGGEIFTRADFPEIYMYAKRKGFIIELFSNGFGITDEIISMLKKYPPLLVDISLYGSNEETYRNVTGIRGAFKRVITNCKKLIEAQIRVAIKSPILTLTYDEIDSMKAIVAELGVVFRCSFELVSTLSNDDKTKNYEIPISKVLDYEFSEYINNKIERFKDDLERKELFYCKIGMNSFVIDYQGNICPCMKYRSIGEPFITCNFEKVWKRYGDFKNIILPTNHKCYNCKDYYYCENCPADSLSEFGDLYAYNEHKCIIAKKRAEFYRNIMKK